MHELRYFSLDGQPTRLVSDGGRTAHDPPWPAPARVRTSTPATPHAARASTTGRPPTPGGSLPTVRDRSGSTDTEHAPLPIRGVPITHVNSSPNSIEGSQEITTAAALPRPAEGGDPSFDVRLVSTLLPNLSPARRAKVQQFVRYGSVSAVSTVTALSLLGILIGVFGYPAVWSNIIATGIATIPSFELNRRWVWAHDQRSILRQALPYFALSFFGLVVSTFAVHLASDATVHSSRLMHTLAAEGANVAAYGSLWLVQFFLCDRILFRQPKAEKSTQSPHHLVMEPPAVAPVRSAEAVPV